MTAIGQAVKRRAGRPGDAGNAGTASRSTVKVAVPPVVKVQAVPNDEGGVDVSWSATDEGAGVSHYDLDVSVDGGAWQRVLTNTQSTGTHYPGELGHSYAFRVTATDWVSNAASAEARAFTRHVTKYYYLGGQRVAMRGPDGAVVWLHADHLGSTSLATDANQTVLSRQVYYPFGQVRWGEETLPTDFGFTGQREGRAIGLYDYHARWYDPWLGRFVSADTVVPEAGDPQQLNRFSYVRNNPLSFFDPTGHSCASPMDVHEKRMCNEWEQTMLNSTVIIYMEGYYLEEFYTADGTKVRKSTFAKTSGLGTIVDSNVIYTHDHSSLLLGDNTVLTKLEIYDANGALLTSPSSYPKPSYETLGYMGILTLKEVSIQPTVKVGDHDSLKPGSELGRVVRSRDDSKTAEVQWTEFDDWDETAFIGTFFTTDELMLGDSGGGVFYRGDWVGSNYGKSGRVGVLPPLTVQQDDN